MKAPDFLHGAANEVAPRLLGWRLQATVDGETTEIQLTEVEAYSQEDPASHSYIGLRPRNAVMFGSAGLLYVYRSYGVHWCANVVCGPDGFGAAVLLRTGKPLQGIEVIARRRGRSDRLATGPGNLTQALGISGDHSGLDLFAQGSPVSLRPGPAPDHYVVTPRIGVSKGADTPWRFVSLS